MSGTIRNNGQNSARELERARVQADRRRAARGRLEERALDERALRARTGHNWS
jgi:hypothetical protein